MNNNSFLWHVANDLMAKYGSDLSQLTIVFPNKRASLFLNEYLARLSGGKPLWSPAYTTISDLFRQQSATLLADPIKLVCELYRSFTAKTGIDETLDHFYGWGQLLLNDFDDIDKQMADADHVFAHLSDLHELDDDSYVTDEQRQALRQFFSHFSEGHNSELKQRFLRLWTHIGDIYHDFNQRLASKGLAYEGALYREVVKSLEHRELSDETVYVFVGFNMLLRVEHRLFTLLQREGKARFYWDFDHYYMNGSEAGHSIRQYLGEFPNELDIDNDSIYRCFSEPKRIVMASAATENIQARYATQWLREQGRLDDGRQTAIVLGNEGLLPAVVHCLPEEVGAVNITTGYPMAQAPAASLLNRLLSLRRDGYDHQQRHFRLRQTGRLLRHPYVVSASQQAAALLQQLQADKNYYPTHEQLSVDALTSLLFKPFPKEYDRIELLRWLSDVIKAIAQTQGTADTPTGSDPLAAESLFRTYTLLNRMLNLAKDGDLDVDMATLARLIGQLIQATTVPFHGEPAEGLQIMGMLETRNLDFSHVLLLSAQEGNLPRGNTDNSFIPLTLRRAYGLTTPDHKAAIYSYYFHRLLQRASDITLVYNNATTDGQKGEMSRFLLQLMVECPHHISHITLQGGQECTMGRPKAVANKALPPKQLSPTAINTYLRCQLRFHYRYVCNLSEPDETEDDISDNRIFGNIFHEACEIIYKRFKGHGSSLITAQAIDKLLKEGADIERAVDQAFRKHLFHVADDRPNFHPRLNGLQIINRQVIIHYLRTLLSNDRQLAPFTILSLEDDFSMPIEVRPGLTVNVGGRIDRLDMITPIALDDTSLPAQDVIRVVDYKTGAHRLKALPDVEAVFNPDNLKEHSDYYLQAMLYSIIVARQHPEYPVAPALLFIQHAAAPGYDPVLYFGRQRIDNVRDYDEPFVEQLRQVIDRMFNHSQPLEPTTDTQRCIACPYRQLCYTNGESKPVQSSPRA